MIRSIETSQFCPKVFASNHSLMSKISFEILEGFNFMNASIIKYTSICISANEFEQKGNMKKYL